MANTINASTVNNGLVYSADASGILELQSNGITGLTVGTGGMITVSNLSVTGNLNLNVSIQPSAIKGSNILTPPIFQDSAGTQIGTLCRAWVKITVGGTSPSIAKQFNVSSITYLGTGQWTINFTNPFPSTNYVGFIQMDSNYRVTTSITAQNTTSASISVRISDIGGPLYNPGTLYAGFFE